MSFARAARRRLRSALVRREAVAIGFAICAVSSACSGALEWPAIDMEPGSGLVRIRVLEDGEPVPARIEVLGSGGRGLIAGDAIPLIGDCEARSEPLSPDTLASIEAQAFPYAATGTDQYYTSGRSQLAVPADTYRVTAWRGPEYRRASLEVTVIPGEVVEADLSPRAWIDMSSRGWYSGDTHLHVPRPDRSRDPELVTWLRAEDLQVGNMLQWGDAASFVRAVQGDLGSPTQIGETILLPGQENPRTGFLGHMMVLNPSGPVSIPDDYLNYRRAAEAARSGRGLVGLGHSGGYGGDTGLALLGQSGLIDFLEVFTFRTPDYDLWYEALAAGLPLAATAGSDFPCGGGGVPPGGQRVYARVEGSLTPESWLAGLAAGRTFVTDGTMLGLEIEGVGIGERLYLEQPREVDVRGWARFDPERESLRALDLMVGEQLAEVYSEPTGPGEIAFHERIRVDRSTRISIRTFGRKLPWATAWQNSFAHSGVIHIDVEGAPEPARTTRGRRSLQVWAERLRLLRTQLLDEESFEDLQGIGKDQVSPEQLNRLRFGLLRDLQILLDG